MLTMLTGQFDHCPNPGDTFWYATYDKDAGAIVPQSGVWKDDMFSLDTIKTQGYFNIGAVLVTDYATGWGNCFVSKQACQSAIERNWFTHAHDKSHDKRWAETMLKEYQLIIEEIKPFIDDYKWAKKQYEHHLNELDRMKKIIETGVYF